MTILIEIPDHLLSSRNDPRRVAGMLQALDECIRINGTLVEAGTDVIRTKAGTRIVQHYKLPLIAGNIYIESLIIDGERPTSRTWFNQHGQTIEIEPAALKHASLIAQFTRFPGNWTLDGALESLNRLKYELALRALR